MLALCASTLVSYSQAAGNKCYVETDAPFPLVGTKLSDKTSVYDEKTTTEMF